MKSNRMYKIVLMSLIFILGLNLNVQAKYVIEKNVIAAKLEVDMTSPTLEINYSSKEKVNIETGVKVTIKSDEIVQEIDGWEISENKKEITKIFHENIKQDITIYDLSGNESIAKIEIHNICENKPQLEKIEFTNTNEKYPAYANNTATIVAKIYIKDEMNITQEIDLEDIEILVDGKTSNCSKKINNITVNGNYIILEVEMNNIAGDGNLQIKIEEEQIENEIGNKNDEILCDVQVLIDNTSPKWNIEEEKQSTKEALVKIVSDEKLRNIEGWSLSDDEQSMQRLFPSNIKYERTICDLAGNTSIVYIQVQDAEYIKLEYCSYSSDIGWKMDYQSSQIAGKEAVLRNIKYKIEAILFTLSGGVEKDFISAGGYINDYWTDTWGKCTTTGIRYRGGFNPPLTAGWRNLLSEEVTQINGKTYFEIGGSGMNEKGVTNEDGEEPIPESEASLYKYGISKIRLKLKSTEKYSIIYQVLNENTGWTKTTQNGSLTTGNLSNPMSAFRIAVVPNEEIDYILEYWNKKEGTFDINE